MVMKEGMRYSSTDDLVKRTFDLALAAYEPYHTKDHQRINPKDDYNPEHVVTWGRAWLTVLTVSNWEGDNLPVSALEQRLALIATMDEGDILEAMYG